MDGMFSPSIGHNSKAPIVEAVLPAQLDAGVLRDQLLLDHADLITKRDELISEATRYLDQFPKGPTNDEEMGRAADMVKDIKETAKKAEDAHKDAKKPYLECGRAVDTVLKQETGDKLTSTAKLLERGMGTYAAAKAAAAQKAAQEEAARQASAAQRLAEAAAAETNALRSEAIMEQAVAAADIGDAATKVATASTADLSRVRGSFGSQAALYDNWTYEVVDLMELVRAVAAGTAPLSYLMLNDSVVGGVVRPKTGMRSIPGLKIENKPTARVR